ncbi:PP2C family protein-serine/threonine phosphatase [Amycolatopsis magusensis]|uniref:PP2C family protein-serine/threonine phosphatase n=1 Tax=Amycolatopsis magusensis TaxID=882444 RepID=UPI0024A7E705|nr:serine/threonine protein phosphatase [Amycolatopsis magusensis]MDI5979326.1 serine/threonine protein phosphatase [Amycolatopsis magusensis]
MMTTLQLPLGHRPMSDSVSRRGPRSINADAVATHTDAVSGRTAFVVADGVGDHLLAARAARLSARVAAEAGARSGAYAGLLASQEELRTQFDEKQADCVLIVAILPPLNAPEEALADIAWVGDCRLYRWNGRVLSQLTVDHTLAEFWRSQDLVPSARMEHVVTDSVRTARESDIGRAHTPVRGGRLLLCTDGVHKTLGMPAVKTLLATADDPHTAATDLVQTAHTLGSTDNATAVVVDLQPLT